MSGNNIGSEAKRNDTKRAPAVRLVNKESYYHDVYGFFVEGAFKEMLSRERKRTERSHNPFLLVLIDVSRVHVHAKLSGPVENITGILIVKRLLKRLSEMTRDIDIKGWYEQGSVIGVIFTELRGINKSTLLAKVRVCIDDTVDEQHASLIGLTGFSFPSDSQDSEHPEQTGGAMAFYPESVAGSVWQLISLATKRLIDITGSLVGIVMFLPVFLIFPVVIKLTSDGPVFFRQTRVGQGGRPFTFLKFRSMYVNNSDQIHQEYVRNLIKGTPRSDGSKENVYKIQNDPRITPVGRFLRKTSFDEIPQFFNVLIGDMSLVGPRPAIPYETEEYDLWHRRRLIESKPGLTGLWQVDGRSKTTFDGMVRMDLRYSRKRSAWLDLKLILKTPLALVTAKGAY